LKKKEDSKVVECFKKTLLLFEVVCC